MIDTPLLDLSHNILKHNNVYDWLPQYVREPMCVCVSNLTYMVYLNFKRTYGWAVLT